MVDKNRKNRRPRSFLFLLATVIWRPQIEGLTTPVTPYNRRRPEGISRCPVTVVAAQFKPKRWSSEVKVQLFSGRMVVYDHFAMTCKEALVLKL